MAHYNISFFIYYLLLLFCGIVIDAVSIEKVDVSEELRVLSKQVTTLLERRRDDIQLIEDNMRKSLAKSHELSDVRNEMKQLRYELDLLRSSNSNNKQQQQQQPATTTERNNDENAETKLTTTQQRNDHLILKWLSSAMAELKTELNEVQTMLNTSALLADRETEKMQMRLFETDVRDVSKELTRQRNGHEKCEANLNRVQDEIRALKEDARVTAIVCGKTKNQLKIAQLEWKQFQNEHTMEEQQQQQQHPTRHQKTIRKHLLDLERNTRHLRISNTQLQHRIEELERKLTKESKSESEPEQTNELPETQSYDSNLTQQQDQLINYDKLHHSMLEMLENVESIESKVDKTIPDFRTEISKLEFQMAESVAKIAALKEDQMNTRDTVKAIGVSVSNLHDHFHQQQILYDEINSTVRQLKESNTIQNSKLHDHIKKSESSTLDLNSTKSTIHLVEELKSFENEYKAIVNKLPHDCTSVSGPNGIYLIAPDDGEPIMATCQNGWTVIQKRYDGSVNFNRKWNEYSTGFGSAAGEHWLGNRNLNSLTRDNCSELEINMKDIYGHEWRAHYEYFHVADFRTGFKLTVSGYSGNASDAFDYQNHMEFSTVDNDRDISNTHCASNYEGGWWFSHCQHANLNGRYNLGLTWFDGSRNEWIAVSTTEMKIRRKPNCSTKTVVDEAFV